MDRFTARAADGFQVAAYRWDPQQGEPRAVLQILHGMAEHASRYDAVAKVFARQGFVVHAHDHRGHGASRPGDWPRGHIGDADGWRHLLSDAHTRAVAIRNEHPDLPRVILAHSMGGYVAQGLLTEHPADADAWAISGSGGKPPRLAAAGRLVARAERLRLGGKGVSAILRKLTFEDFNKSFEGRTDFDWLSRDSAQVDAYIADPECGYDVTVETWLQLFDALPGLTRPERLRRIPQEKPLYVFGGTADTSVECGEGLRRLASAYREAGLRDVTLKLWPDARHEVLNEVNREEVVSDLVAWAATKCGLDRGARPAM